MFSTKTYWSCSKFADWLRGTAKPYAGTAEEWDKWRKTAKTKKIRYWLAEEALDYLQNTIYWPLNSANAIHYYIRNRWICKTHALTSNLERGQWHEFDTRLLHTAFDELRNFVEKEAGINHLEWATDLKHDEEWVDKSDPSFGQPTSQALAAQEIIALYRWWKEQRPNRVDPMEASGWNDYYEKKCQTGDISDEDPLSNYSSTTEHEKELSGKILNLCHQMEQEQADEDTLMLIRLIKIRQNIWT